jgi:hypothetical protein
VKVSGGNPFPLVMQTAFVGSTELIGSVCITGGDSWQSLPSHASQRVLTPRGLISRVLAALRAVLLT